MEPILDGLADARLDLRRTPCPINFVRSKLRLEHMEPNQLLEIWLDAGEPIEQVPDSLIMAGYGVEGVHNLGEFYALFVRKPMHDVVSV